MALTELDYDAAALPDNSTFRVCEQVSHGPDGTLLVAKGITGGITAYANAGWSEPHGSYVVIHSVSGINTDNCNVLIGDCVRFGASTFLFTVCGKINSTYQNAAVYVVDNTGSVIHTHSFGTGAGRPGGIVATSSTTAYVTILDSSGVEIYKTTDGGATWGLQGAVTATPHETCRSGLVKVDSTLTAFLYGVSASTVNTYTSTDDGVTWAAAVTLPDAGLVSTAQPNSNAIADSVPPTVQCYSSTLWVMGYWKFSTTKVKLAISQDGGATWSTVDVATAGGTATVSVYVVHSTHFIVHYSDDDGAIDGVYDQPHATESYDQGANWTAIPTITHAPASTLGAVYQAKITASQAATSGLDGGIYSAYTGFSAVSSTVPAAFGATYPLTGTNPDTGGATTAESSSTLHSATFDVSMAEGASLVHSAAFDVSASQGPSFFHTTSLAAQEAEGASIPFTTSFPYVYDVADTLGWTDSIVINSTRSFAVVDNINFTQRLDLEYSMFDTLALAQSIGLNLVLSKDVIDSIALTDLIGLAFERDEDDADNLSLTQSVGLNLQLSKSDSDTLSLTQQVAYDLVRPVEDDLALTQDIGLNLVLSFDVVDDLELSDDAVAWSDSPVGVVDHDCLDPAFPHLGIRDSFTFSWPAMSPSLIVDIKIPEFGNTQEFEWGKVVRRTLGGQLSIANDASWPVVDVLKWSFRFLSQAKRDDLEAFFTASAGDLIAVTDHENTDWTGVITDDEVTFKPEGVGCQWAFDVNFRVVTRSAE